MPKKAANTQEVQEYDMAADLLAGASQMAEGSDLGHETTPSDDDSEPTSETVAPESGASKEIAGEPDEFELARTSSQARLNSFIVERAQMQARAEQAEREAAQWRKNHQEAQSYGDKRNNEAQQQLAKLKAENEELLRQLHSRERDVQEDPEYYGEAERQTERRVAADPEVAALRQDLAEFRQRRDEEVARIKAVAEQQAKIDSLATFARQACDDVYGKDTTQLTDAEREVMRQIAILEWDGDHRGVARLMARAANQATTERMAAIRARAVKSRVISEAGSNSATEDEGSMDDTDEVFRDLNLDVKGLSEPQVEQGMNNFLNKAAGRMAKQPPNARDLKP